LTELGSSIGSFTLTRAIGSLRSPELIAGTVEFGPIHDAPAVEQAYLLASQSPHFFFLDSSLADGVLGRFSFVGWEPKLILSCYGKNVLIETSGGERRRGGSNPFSVLRRFLPPLLATPEELPFPFAGGFVGYFGYDLCHFLERLPRTVERDIPLPDLYLAFYDRLLAFDHVDEKVYAVTCAAGRETKEALKEAVGFATRAASVVPTQKVSPRTEGIRCGFSRSSYVAAVERAREYIFAGDIFEVNLSQRFQTKLRSDDVSLYLKLRTINPAPFACHIGFDGQAVLSSSPELFLRVTGNRVETRPIKGTRPRAGSLEEDLRLRQELLHSEKDSAELNMIIDLERNDLGKVCSYGTVRVKQHKVVETYPTVHHLVGTVVGELHPGKDLVDLLKATFPGGSITGAPKIRSMEIIDELEPTARSVYTGSVGYLGTGGRSELNISIRTFLRSGDDLYFQVGGAVVADSDPESEYEETLDKAKALFAAIGADVDDWR